MEIFAWPSVQLQDEPATRRGMMAKTILITGASSGIGRASALYFAENGWNVAATMRDPRKTDAALQRGLRLVRPDRSERPRTDSTSVCDELLRLDRSYSASHPGDAHRWRRPDPECIFHRGPSGAALCFFLRRNKVCSGRLERIDAL